MNRTSPSVFLLGLGAYPRFVRFSDVVVHPFKPSEVGRNGYARAPVREESEGGGGRNVTLKLKVDASRIPRALSIRGCSAVLLLEST